MIAKDWIGMLCQSLKSDKFPAPDLHFKFFVSGLAGEKSLPKGALTPATVEAVAHSITFDLGVYPTYKELVAAIAKAHGTLEAARPKAVAGPTGPREDGLSTADQMALDRFRETIGEKQGQEREITVSWLRTYHRDAYLLIADDFDRERFREERRRTAESRDRQEQHARDVAQAKFVQSQRVEFVPPHAVPAQARTLARQNALPGPGYKPSHAI